MALRFSQMCRIYFSTCFDSGAGDMVLRGVRRWWCWDALACVQKKRQFYQGLSSKYKVFLIIQANACFDFSVLNVISIGKQNEQDRCKRGISVWIVVSIFFFSILGYYILLECRLMLQMWRHHRESQTILILSNTYANWKMP